MKFIKVLIFLLISANSFAQYYSPVKTPIQWTQGGFDSLFIPARDTIMPGDKTKPWITYRAPTLYVWTTNKWTAISGGGGGGGTDYTLPQADSNTLGGIRYNTDFALDLNNRLGIAPGKKALWNTIANLPLFYATGDSTRGMIRDSIAKHKLKFNPNNFNIFPDSIDIINKPFTEADSVFRSSPANLLTTEDIINVQSINDTSIHPRTSDVHNWIAGIKMDTLKLNSAQFYKTPDSVVNIYSSGVGGSSNVKVTTTDSLITLASIDPSTVYETTDKGGGFWRYDPSDITTPDNVGTVRVNGTKRLKRIYSGKANIVWFGAVGDGIFDNYSILNNFATNSGLSTDIYIPPGTYYCSQNISFTRYVHISGADGYEIPASQTIITFPFGVSGFTFNNSSSAGSILEGFTLQGQLVNGGSIMEYNPDDSRMLYISPLTTITSGSYEFVDPYHPDVVKGTATASGTVTSGISRSIVFSSITGSFTVGTTITGNTSGASATILFVSKLYNAVVTGAITGTFVAGETVSGGGASGIFKSFNVINSSLRVTTLSGVSGDINGTNIEGKRMSIFRQAGSYAIGITANRRIQITNMSTLTFGADGVLITNLTTPVSNANRTMVNHLRSNANGGSGIRIEGGDANALQIDPSTFVNNLGFAVCDLSFLGITVNNPHASLNLSGHYTSGSYINRKTVWINPYAEGGYVVTPWQGQESYIAGAAQIIGGVRGSPVINDNYLNSGGGDFDMSNLKNNRTYTDASTQVFTANTGTDAEPLAIELKGNGGANRTVRMGFRIPYNTGTETIHSKPASLKAAEFAAASNSKYYLRQRVKRNAAPTITITGAGGSGALVLADVLNGKIIKVNVLAPGVAYPTKTTTATVAAPSGGTAAILRPVIFDGKLSDVEIIDSGSNYLDTDLMDLVEATTENSGTFRPVADNLVMLGDAAHNYSHVYGNTFHVGTPTITSGTGSPEGVVSASNNCIFLRTDSAKAYIKKSNGGNVGWEVIATEAGGKALAINFSGNYINTYAGNTNNLTFGAAPGLNIVTRFASGWSNALNIYTGGYNSGVTLSSSVGNRSELTTGGYKLDPASQVYQNFMPQETSMTSLAADAGTYYFNGKTGLTPGTLTDLDSYATLNSNGLNLKGYLSFTAQSLPSASAGMFNYDGSNFYLTPNTTRKRVPLTNNVTPSNGQIPIGNGTDYTVANLTAGTGISIANSSGGITISATGSGGGGGTSAAIVDSPEHTFTGTWTWTGTAPTSPVAYYRWTQTGKMVTLNISWAAATAGTGVTQVMWSLPSDCPPPIAPTNFGAINSVTYPANGFLSTSGSGTNVSTINSVAAMYKDASGYNIYVTQASNAYIKGFVTVTYWTNGSGVSP